MPVTKDKKLEKKMKIIETAFSLFQQNTVGATAIDDIVKSAGIARGTFYLYFKDKSDLLEQIIMYKSTECMRIMLRKVFEAESSEELDLISFSRMILYELIKFMECHKDVLTVVAKNMSSCMRRLPEFYDSEIGDFYSRIIRKMTDSGYSDEKKAERTVYIVADMICSLCADAIMVGRPFMIDDIREDIVNSALAVIEAGR